MGTNFSTVKKLVAATFGLLSLIALAELIICVIPYMTCPVYDFTETIPFGGSRIYNPYEGAFPAEWKKAALHTHTTASEGENTVEELENAYRKYGYDILAITDHSEITPGGLPDGIIMNSYEHGVNIGLNHIVSLGAAKGSTFDYRLINTRSNRYHMVRLLEEKADVIIFAHPSRIRGFVPGDMKFIENYHLMELGRWREGGKQDYYDAALSAGHYANAVASDDCHDVSRPSMFVRTATFINTRSESYGEIRDALLSGQSFAVVMPQFEDPEYKLKRNLQLPYMTGYSVADNTLSFSVSEPAVINVYSQGGTLKNTFKDATEAVVPFRKEDTYLRFTAEFSDGVILYSNPAYRYTGNIPRQSIASVDYHMTSVQTLFLSALLVCLVRLFFLVLVRMLPLKAAVWLNRHRIFITACGPAADGIAEKL